MKLADNQKIKIACLYILFGFGGLWHFLGWFQFWMRILAAPLIICVSLLLFYEVLKSLPGKSKIRFVIWSITVFCVGFGIEVFGIHTNIPFGRYKYGSVLQPHFLKVPLAIGFAWLLITLSSLLMTMKLVRYCNMKYKYIITPILTGIFMLIFDLIMEKAAPKLEYWTWEGNVVPIQNYLAWFILGTLFSFFWHCYKSAIDSDDNFYFHVYLSQLIYFAFVIF